MRDSQKLKKNKRKQSKKTVKGTKKDSSFVPQKQEKSKKQHFHFIWSFALFFRYFVPGLLIYTLILFIAADVIIRQQINALQIRPDPFPQFTFSDYPVGDVHYIPDVTASAAIVMDVSSKVLLYQKNTTLRFSPASTTKLMTAIVALDYFKSDDVLTIKRIVDTQGAGLGLIPGETMTFKNLLYAMMLPSANDAAVAVADNYPGGEAAFVKAMNSKALRLGLWDTHFADPDGLDDDHDYTSAKDLIRIAAIAIDNPLLSPIVATKQTTIFSSDGKYSYAIKNLNHLLGTQGVNGIKTGTTEDAGEVLVTSSILHGHAYLLVVMKSSDRFSDTNKLLRFLDRHVTYLSIHP